MVLVLVAVAGFAAGFMNVLAGGGSFLTLPAMIAAGLTALGANASSTVALFPSQVVTAVLARHDLAVPDEAEGVSVRTLSVISLAGGFLGALLLLVTPPGVFTKIVPWLILFATGVFARGRQIGEGAMGLRLGRRGIYAVQALVAIYGGYFGGGIGILMLAALTVFGMRDMRAMTSLKILLASLMNVAAVATFLVAGLVTWPATIVLGTAALLGGMAGVAANKRVPATWVRGFVIAIGLVLSAWFFLRLRAGWLQPPRMYLTGVLRRGIIMTPDRSTTTVSTKGQVILPKAIRERRQWPPGTRLQVELTSDGVLLRPARLFATTDPADIFGILHDERPAETTEDMKDAIAKGVRDRYARGRY